MRRADVLFVAEGQTAVEHVVEEDTQRPDGGLASEVQIVQEPFGRAIETSA